MLLLIIVLVLNFFFLFFFLGLHSNLRLYNWHLIEFPKEALANEVIMVL